MSQGHLKTLIEIEMLFAPGCASQDDTRSMVERVIKAGRLHAGITETIVTTQQEAVERKFLGSPSVRVNGIDIDPHAAGRLDYGLG